MIELCVVLAIAFAVSLALNVVFVLYAKATLSKIDTIYTASETASEIFTMLDAYRSHLNSVYDMPLFYGDETLQGLLEHTNQLAAYIKQYEGVYSFTQPDLEERLSLTSVNPNDGSEEAQKEE